jgi:hypothetical protein
MHLHGNARAPHRAQVTAILPPDMPLACQACFRQVMPFKPSPSLLLDFHHYLGYTSHQRMLRDIVMNEMRNTRPLSVLMAEQVQALREWASGRTVPAD